MILGSDNGTTDAKSVIIYDPDNDKFTSAPSMLYGRNGAGCAMFYSALHENRPVILAAGGRNGVTAEIFDYTVAEKWEEITSLPNTNISDYYGIKALTSV